LKATDGEVIACGSYRKTKGKLEIKRFCSRIGVSVQGGFSRMTRAAVKKAELAVESWCDLRYAHGTSYECLGFLPVRETQGWVWSDGVRTYNRLFCRANMDARQLPEVQHAQELKLFKIYDAGQRLYRLERNGSI
jgi:hypothetical protein